MRRLLCVFLSAITIVFSLSASANKPRLPNQITLELVQPAISGNILLVNSQFTSLLDFTYGAVTLMLSEDGVGARPTVTLWSGSGQIGFEQSMQYQLPSLPLGKYRLHAVFNIFVNEKDATPIRSGRNLFIEVRDNHILSSNVSFVQIRRDEVNAQLQQRRKLNLSNERAVLKQQAPQLYQSMQLNTRVPVVESNTLKSIGVQRGNHIKPAKSKLATLTGTLELSTSSSSSAPDPEKVNKLKAAIIEENDDEL